MLRNESNVIIANHLQLVYFPRSHVLPVCSFFPCISIVDLGFYRVSLEFLQYLALWCLVHLVLGFLAFLRKSLCVLACQASEFLVSQAEEFSRVERISLLVCQA